MMTTIWDRLALLFSLIVIVAAFLISSQVFENIPHLEDEFAYLWQAKLMAEGNLSLESPKFSKNFLIPFVVDYQGQRFAKYPPGWPAVLSLGVRVGLLEWVNPILAGLSAWLTYQLGKRALEKKTALLGMVLMATSPLFLIQSGTLLSHVWSLVTATAFFLFWLDGQDEKYQKYRYLPALIGGVSLGLLGLTRPISALAVAIPFLVHGLILLVQGPDWKRKHVVLTGITALILMSFYFVWQYAVTGSLTTNPYTLWWPYDKFGFGEGYGVLEGGHNLLQGWLNTRYSLQVSASDLFGWMNYSWLFLPFGLWAARRTHLAYLSAGMTISLMVLYLAYWVSSWLLGPRYYFEALPGIALISAAGLTWLAGDENFRNGRDPSGIKLRPLLVGTVTLILVISNLYFYLPARLGGLKGLYGIDGSDLAIFESPTVQAYQPALIIVDSEKWMPYGSTLILESPKLDSPFIFAWSRGPRTDRELANYFRAERNILYYYPDQEMYTLYTYPRPDSLIE
jgi:4-amino-4-deoxy-L-arabinose transferase-like glycosyltransferase